MKVTRFYTGEDNLSHFEDLEVPALPTERGNRSDVYPASGIMFRESDGDAHFLELHPAPRRQFILCLTGVVEIELGDGEKRRFGPGDVYLADRPDGRGPHPSRD